MSHQASLRRIVLATILLLSCCMAVGCPSDDDDESPASDAGKAPGTDAGDEAGSGAGNGAGNGAGKGATGGDAAVAAGDAAVGGDKDAGQGTEDAAVPGDGPIVNGGDISGDAALHVEFSMVKDSNVTATDLDSTTPSGTSGVNEGVRSTAIFGSVTEGLAMRQVTVTLMGALVVGATYEMVFEPYNATAGKGFLQLQQGGPSFWRAESGTITIEAIKDTAIKISSSDLSMVVATSNAPGNVATGSFTAKLEAQVLAVSGLE